MESLITVQVISRNPFLLGIQPCMGGVTIYLVSMIASALQGRRQPYQPKSRVKGKSFGKSLLIISLTGINVCAWPKGNFTLSAFHFHGNVSGGKTNDLF